MPHISSGYPPLEAAPPPPPWDEYAYEATTSPPPLPGVSKPSPDDVTAADPSGLDELSSVHLTKHCTLPLPRRVMAEWMNYHGGLVSIVPPNLNSTRSEQPSWWIFELEGFPNSHIANLNLRGGATMVIWFPNREQEPLVFHYPRHYFRLR